MDMPWFYRNFEVVVCLNFQIANPVTHRDFDNHPKLIHALILKSVTFSHEYEKLEERIATNILVD